MEAALLQLFTFADCWRQELRKLSDLEKTTSIGSAGMILLMRDAAKRLLRLQPA
jgi:hypothetical protein